MQTDAGNHVKEDDTDYSVGNGMPWEHERTEGETSNLVPIKSDRDETEPGLVSKKLVHNNVVWCNPSGESKI